LIITVSDLEMAWRQLISVPFMKPINGERL